MGSINTVKELAASDTPLLFFECVLPSGDVEYWSTHAITFNGQPYSARVLKHNLFDLQLSADDAMDGITQLSIVLANADSALSQLNAVIPLKGSQLTVYFAFANLFSGTITTESTILFRGVAGDPDQISEESLTLSFTNKLSLQRIPLPEVRIQSSCPWNFPATLDQRTEALNGGASGRYSRYYRCGYSADVSGGVGNLNAGAAFTTCNKSRSDCQLRGMFDTDANGNETRRFGALEFVPSAIMVRTAGDKTYHLSPLLQNAAKYNDPVPIVYGTGWIKAPVVFARNDGNLTHMEVLLGMGAIQSVMKVVVNDVEIPQGGALNGQNPTVTGWYNVFAMGSREGNFNLDFTDSNGNPLGDPYGSMAAASIVVPNRISSGGTMPNVQVLMQGVQVDIYNPDGSFQTTAYSNNPAWVIVDILRRCGWSLSDLNLPTFAASAAFCQTLITTTDLNGNTIQVPNYECNLVLTKRQSAATVIRGIRVASSLMLRYGMSGLLELLPETTLALQQPALPDGGNSTEPLNGGWPAYEFSDATAPYSGIVRNPDGASTLVLTSRTIAETSNRLSVEFQDEQNEYQQDSFSVVDAEDVALIGYEISSQSTALGIANFSQATRVLLRQLDKSTKGNLFIQFQTSFRALKIRPGDIIAVTYEKEGLVRVPFRVVKLSPSLNYQLVTVMAQIHNDAWYSNNPAVLEAAGRQPATQVQTPRPLIGLIAHDYPPGNFEFFDFAVQETLEAPAGAAIDQLTISFAQPATPSVSISSVPLVSLSPDIHNTGGALPGNTVFYYAITGVDSAGKEGPLSFTVAASTALSGTNTNSVTLTGISLPRPAVAFNVYRGDSPQMLYRIATAQSPATCYTDSGAAVQPIGPPDPNFDHANFYYRYEYAGPFNAAAPFSASSIGNQDMSATPAAYSGMVVRIIEGTGSGQERLISTNDAATLTITSPWSIIPDATSQFVIAQPSWQFAAVSATSPIQFDIPYRKGTVIQISGRAANVSNQEGDADLCPLTRWTLGKAASDNGTPPAPVYVLNAPGGGEVALSQVGFPNGTNTSSISSGTLQLFCWNELDTPTPYALSQELDLNGGTVFLNDLPSFPASTVIQVGVETGAELMTILSVDTAAQSYTVKRGAFSSTPQSYPAGTPVLHLGSSSFVIPFAPTFFSNAASVNFLHTSSLPDVRICASEFFATNVFGDGATTAQCYTSQQELGLRTLSGGQFSLQVSGYLATQQNAAPPLVIEASHAVRDIRATVNQAASGYDIAVDILQNGSVYQSVKIPSGGLASSVYDGVELPPLLEGATLTLNVTLNVTSPAPSSISPGQDLTVTIRL